MVKQRADFTFKHNTKKGRYGWLRLTPAYSVKAVSQFLDTSNPSSKVLDPFAGTGTTGLICAELGLECALIDINPFLGWLTTVKTRHYSAQVLDEAAKLVDAVAQTAAADADAELWVPPIRFIERWWTPSRLQILAEVYQAIQRVAAQANPHSLDLLWVAFSRLVIQWSNAAFNHQSVSFKQPAQPPLFTFSERDEMLDSFRAIATQIVDSAGSQVLVEPRVITGDSRDTATLTQTTFDQVITSPPYPNRMSYIRELRPYMYWLGYLTEAKQAGILDWQAIGGTWGSATSKLATWQPPDDMRIEHPQFYATINAIEASNRKNSALLANYVHRYFVDMQHHLESLYRVLAPGAQVTYIIGNSKFYDILVPVEQFFANIMAMSGFQNPKIEPLRKRNSKKELYEFSVTAYV